MKHCHCRRCRSALDLLKPLDDTTSLLVFFFSLYLSLSSLLRFSTALVHFRANSFSFTFLDAPAQFVPVYGSGICGSLHLADPIDGCYFIGNKTASASTTSIGGGQAGPVRFLLIVRGNCSFERKVRNAQNAGFNAAIVYDDQEKGSLISMIGNSDGIWTHAIFVSKMAGETLKKFSEGSEEECCIGSSTEETAGTVLVISFASLVVIVSVLATFFFARNCRLFRHRARNHPPSINRQEVEVLPCFTFNSAFPNGKCASETCAICLEDYRDGEILRVLPCQHEFHSVCVDLWLTKWGTFCPVCKHEMSSGQ